MSYVTGLAALLVHPLALDYSPFGNGLNWLLGLPCWLFGCKLAEQDFAAFKLSGRLGGNIWHWRMGIWFLGFICSVLRFHSPVGYPWTLILFGMAVYYWLRAEISHWQSRGGIRWLEWAGQWSYSIYLIHMIANAEFGQFHLPELGPILNWVLKMIFVLGTAYLFYLVVEKPAHIIARRLSNVVKRKRKPQAATVATRVATPPAAN